jgi:hypothetical protein
MLREQLPLEPGERESVPIWRIQTGRTRRVVLHSEVMGQARRRCDYWVI